MGEGGGAPLTTICSAIQDALPDAPLLFDSHNSSERIWRLLRRPESSLAMKADGSLSVQASRELMWSRLSDPRELERALPAVEEVEVSDDDSFSVLVAPSTALGETPLWVDVRVAERREGEHVRLVCRGRRGEYDAELAVEISLDGDGDGAGERCEVNWRAEASLRGIWSALGQRVLPAILATQVERVLLAAADG